jgi:L-amino acid N-acyltransferase YncA
VLIRLVADPDWPEVYEIFTSVVEAGDTYAYPEGLSIDEVRALWDPGPPDRCVVALDGRVLGTAKMGPNRPGRGSHVATASFMVAEGARGAGVGRALCEHMLAWAASEGYRGVQFNAVVETNVAAVALWRSLGFTLVGTVPDAFNHRRLGLVGLNVMYRPLP